VRHIGIGIVGGGYMGKAHAVAMQAVGAVFNTRLRPFPEMICTTTEAGAKAKADELGFERSTADWRELVHGEAVEAVVIASPQSTHHAIAMEAVSLGKPVFCEKPLAANLAEARAMTEAAEKAGVPNMIGFNYVRTPATQLAREIIAAGEIGDITYLRGEHTEDFLADPQAPANWRTRDPSTGAMGDLAPHMINAALALAGPIRSLVADIGTVHATRPGKDGPEKVINDDHGQFICRFENGAIGNLYFSRIATGRKMGYAYEVHGTKGALRFDQEDQNALWFYKGDQPANRQGFTKLLTGPEHPDYVNFCLGPGHGTGYQDQIIIEARDFLSAIETGEPVWPTFRDGLEVERVIEAARRSDEARSWIETSDI
jgi:predicted dehydrogenase